MTILTVKTYLAWECPFCEWNVRYWKRPAPESWLSLSPHDQRGISNHFYTHLPRDKNVRFAELRLTPRVWCG